jgi:hypothetical protein
LFNHAVAAAVSGAPKGSTLQRLRMVGKRDFVFDETNMK